MNAFISIPIRCIILDPDSKEQVRALIRRAEAKFRLSARAWEIGNNSGDSATLAAMTRRENRLAAEGAALLAPLGIACDWPGLYPSFKVNGYEEHSTENAILSALGKPRNWLRVEGAQ